MVEAMPYRYDHLASDTDCRPEQHFSRGVIGLGFGGRKMIRRRATAQLRRA